MPFWRKGSRLLEENKNSCTGFFLVKQKNSLRLFAHFYDVSGVDGFCFCVIQVPSTMMPNDKITLNEMFSFRKK